MAGIDEVLERLVTDPAFRARLAADPDAALAGYVLSDDDRAVLATALSQDTGTWGTVERRINRTAFAGLVLDGAADARRFGLADAADTEIDVNADDADPDAETAGSGVAWARRGDEPHPVDQALLASVADWFGNADGIDRPVDAADVAAALGIGSEPLALRVLAALDGQRDDWTGREFLRQVRHLMTGSDHDKLAFAFRLHDLDGDGRVQAADLVTMMTLGLAEDRAAVPSGEPVRLAGALLADAGQRRGGSLSLAEFTSATVGNAMVLELVTHTMARWLALNEDVLARLAAPRTQRMALRRLVRNQAIAVLLVTAWVLANVVLFARATSVYGAENELVQVARGAGACLNLNGALILVPMMRRLLTWVRRTSILRALPVDTAVDFHRLVGSAMFAFALVHTAAHVANYAVAPGVTVLGELLTTTVGLTGLVLLVVFTVMWVCTRPRVRRGSRFELFYATHLLYVVWFALALVHAPNLWMWVAVPLVGFAAEQLLRASRRSGEADVVAGHALRSGVTRLAIARPPGFRHRAGDYVFLRVPDVARHEWHPFTISSAPERDRVSVHVRALGDWTSALRRLVEQRHADRRDDPVVAHIDGPYGAPATHIFDSRDAVLIGAGIGVTPFASVLESVVLRADGAAESTRLRTLHFFWLNRDLYSFEWFAELLAALERDDHRHLVRTHLFLTGDRGDAAAATVALSRRIARISGRRATSLRLRVRVGRPDWARELSDIATACEPEPVDVYFCGPPGLGRAIRRTCADLGVSFRQERF